MADVTAVLKSAGERVPREQPGADNRRGGRSGRYGHCGPRHFATVSFDGELEQFVSPGSLIYAYPSLYCCGARAKSNDQSPQGTALIDADKFSLNDQVIARVGCSTRTALDGKTELPQRSGELER